MFGKKILMLLMLLPFMGFTPLGWAQDQEDAKLQITEAAVATAILDRSPQGTSENFSSDVGRLFAYTRVLGSEGDTVIKHLWFYGDQLLAEIRLSVKSPNWRTYSSKKILPQWTGPWRVDITDEKGLVLKKLNFTIDE